MRDFFSSILKQKKILFFILLFFVISGIFLPKTTFAIEWVDKIIDSIRYAPERVAAFIVISFIALPAITATWIFRMLANMAYATFNYVLSEMIQDPGDQWAITRNPVFLGSWNIIKSYANMFIVLGLITIALATILKFREDYGAKKLLPTLIGVALLVNFSTVFVGIMIDASNLVMKHLVVGGEQQGTIISSLNIAHNNIVDPLYNQAIASASEAKDWYAPIGIGLTYISAEYIFAAIYLAVAVILFLITLVFIERYIMLAILFIFSPLAFVAFIFPATKKFFSNWLHRFLTACFSGVIAAFFLKLSVGILTVLRTTFQGESVLDTMPKIWMHLLIVQGFLFAGYKSAKKSSIVATTVIDTAKAVAGVVIGATAAVATGGASAALRATGIPGAAQRAKEGMSYYGTKLAERFEPLTGVRKGTADRMRQQMLQKQVSTSESEEKMSAMSSEERVKLASKFRDNRLLSITPVDPTKIQETVGLTKALLKNKEFGNLDNAQQRQLIEFIKSNAPSTISMKEFSKVNADYGAYDTDAVNQEKRKLIGKTNPRTGNAYLEHDMNNPNAAQFKDMQTDAENTVIRDAYAKMDDSEFKKMSNQDIATEAKQETARGKLALEEAIKRNILGMVGSFAETATLIQGSEKYGSKAMYEAKKIDPKYAEYDTKGIHEQLTKNGVPNPTMVPTTSPDFIRAQQEVKSNAYKKLTAGSIRKDLSDDAFDLELVKNVSAKKISEANKQEGLSTKKIEKLKALEADIQAKVLNAYATGNNDEADQWAAKLKAIRALS